MKTFDSIRNIVTSQGDDHTTVCRLDYNYFKNYWNIIAIDLIKQQALDADPKVVEQMTFTGNLDRVARATMFFVTEEAKETILDIWQRTVKVL